MLEILGVADEATLVSYVLTYGWRVAFTLWFGYFAYCCIKALQGAGSCSAQAATAAPASKAKKSGRGSSQLLPVAEQLETSVKEIINVRPASLQHLTVQQHEVDAKPVKGSGAEGEFRLASAIEGWKIFFTPRHKFDGSAAEQKEQRQAMKRKHAELPARIAQLPHGEFASPWMVLPTGALKIAGTPERVGGVVMPYIDGSPFSDFTTPKGRRRNGISMKQVGAVFLQLYDAIEWCHSIGMAGLDLKAENLRVKGGRLFQIDLEGAGFGQFLPMAATAELYPVEMCDQDGVPIVTPNRVSDWYAYLVLLCQAYTGEHPAGGIHTPPAGSGAPQLDGVYQRLKARVSIFNAQVDTARETRKAIRRLPAALRNLLIEVFEGGSRGKPPREMIERLANPGLLGFFAACIESLASPLKARCWANGHTLQPQTASCLKTTNIKALYTGRGEILAGKMMPDSSGQSMPAVLIREGINIIANNGKPWLSNTTKSAQFVLLGDRLETELVKGGPDVIARDMVMSPLVTSMATGRPTVDIFVRSAKISEARVSGVAQLKNGLPAVVMQGGTPFWMADGKLYRMDQSGKTHVATISGEVSIFSGDHFGVATAVSEKTREITGLFMFDGSGVKRLIGYPTLQGEVTDVECYFGPDTAWLFITARYNEHITDYVMAFKRSGELLGWAGAENGEMPATCPGIARCASASGVYAVAEGLLYHLQCDRTAISVVSITRTTGLENPTVIMTDGSTIFGA